jgi:hypothetical protein
VQGNLLKESLTCLFEIEDSHDESLLRDEASGKLLTDDEELNRYVPLPQWMYSAT